MKGPSLIHKLHLRVFSQWLFPWDYLHCSLCCTLRSFSKRSLFKRSSEQLCHLYLTQDTKDIGQRICTKHLDFGDLIGRQLNILCPSSVIYQWFFKNFLNHSLINFIPGTIHRDDRHAYGSGHINIPQLW